MTKTPYTDSLMRRAGSMDCNRVVIPANLCRDLEISTSTLLNFSDNLATSAKAYLKSVEAYIRVPDELERANAMVESGRALNRMIYEYQKRRKNQSLTTEEKSPEGL